MAGQPKLQERISLLTAKRNEKMARSAHAYMRGNTIKFYEWLETASGRAIPAGPPVWICGDCHVGNLGPLADIKGNVDVQIRDLDQTVVGNPAHDLVRLGLSLATAARSSNLSGITTAHMIERMVEGYESGLTGQRKAALVASAQAQAIQRVMQQALKRRWKHLAEERIEDVKPTIPRGDRFWDTEKSEKKELQALLDSKELRALITSLHDRKPDAKLQMVDAAYWVKGCSSLGRLRYAVLVGVDKYKKNEGGICFLDIKEATAAAAPRAPGVSMPRDNAARVVEGARALSPNLGDRMMASRIGERPVIVRELMPQDLKLELDQLAIEEAVNASRYLAGVVGRAHARQMNSETRRNWLKELTRRSKTLDAPSWLWGSIVELLGIHEAAYLDHCRKLLAA